MLKPAESKAFKTHIDKLKDSYAELTTLSLTCPAEDMQLMGLLLARLNDTIRCSCLISTSFSEEE